MRTADIAPTSIGSPRGVPVPCIVTSATASIEALDEFSAPRITSCWAGPFGAVSAPDLPSWFTNTPAIKVDVDAIFSAFAIARSMIKNAAHASPRVYPLASMSRVLHRPSAAIIPAQVNIAVVSGA